MNCHHGKCLKSVDMKAWPHDIANKHSTPKIHVKKLYSVKKRIVTTKAVVCCYARLVTNIAEISRTS